MKVLVACECSGTVRDAFLRLGHDAVSCDLKPCLVPGPHIEGDCLGLLRSGAWDILIAHPPCTFLSNAGAVRLHHKGVINSYRAQNGFAAKEFFLRLLNAPVPKICIENPVPSSFFGLPRYDHIIDPSEFGESFKKRTCLWLRGLPPLLPTDLVLNAIPAMKSDWFNKGSGVARQSRRAVTFPGIASAMAKQWGGAA